MPCLPWTASLKQGVRIRPFSLKVFPVRCLIIATREVHNIMPKYVSKNVITVFWALKRCLLTSRCFHVEMSLDSARPSAPLPALEGAVLDPCGSAHLPSHHGEHHLFHIDVCLCGATLKYMGSWLFLSQADAVTESRGYGDELPFWNMCHGLSRRSWPGTIKPFRTVHLWMRMHEICLCSTPPITQKHL